MDIVWLFIIIAILAEALYDTIKLILPFNPAPQVDRAAVIVLAVFMCVATGSDLFATFGVVLPWNSGAFFSGILCSRGANYLHDLVGKLGGE